MKENHHLKRLLCVMMAAAMVLGLSVPVLAAEGERVPVVIEKIGEGDDAGVLSDRELPGDLPAASVPDPEETVRVSIVLEAPSTIDAGFAPETVSDSPRAIAYRGGLEVEQARVEAAIEREVLGSRPLDVVWNMTLAANIISANVRRGDIDAIAALPGVETVVEETRYTPQVIDVGGELQPNMAISGTMNGAQEAWDTGYTGADSKIAIIDTGLAIDHQSFDPEAFDHAIAEINAARAEEGLDSVELMDAAYIAKYLPELNIAKNIDTDIAAGDLYKNTKVPFGFNYVDRTAGYITHDRDSQGEHGSHVAGIAAANRYVPDGNGGFADALDAVKAAGNAPDAQLMVMKVFGQGGGAYDSDYMVAIEDAMILGADAINLSLGSAAAGLAAPDGQSGELYKGILDSLTRNGSVVTVSAGNSGAWADSTYNGALYDDGVSFDTVGSPGSYANAFTVASVDNDGMISPTIEAGGTKFGFADTGSNYELPAFTTLDKGEGENTYPFLMIDRAGTEAADLALALEALGVDNLDGCVVVLRRGISSFSDKANAAAGIGAVGVIVADNQPGLINMDLSSYVGSAPAVSITQADGDALWSSGEAVNVVEGLSCVTGQLTVNSAVSVVGGGAGHYTVSSFSSWGVPGDLSLKPEITAPGGNIWSVNGLTDSGYELMSGTSMAAPQVAGLSALVQQYLRDKGVTVNGMTRRALTQSLLMSTAAPMRDADGNFYSVFQQGAGLANANDAVTTPVTVTVAGQEDGKAKAELGDDPGRSGVYTVTFTIHNLSMDNLDYFLSGDVFTQALEDGFLLGSTVPLSASVTFRGVDCALTTPDITAYDFNGDGRTDRDDAQYLLTAIVTGEAVPNGDVNGDGRTTTADAHGLLKLLDGQLTVARGSSATVTATITLDKSQLASYPAGAYVEAYITATPAATEEGVVPPAVSFPVLGYYGSWTTPSMFDISYEDLATGNDTRYPYLYDYTGGLTNILTMGEEEYIIYNGDSITGTMDLGNYYYSLIRNAGDGVVIVENPLTGEEYYRSGNLGPQYAAYYNAGGGSFAGVQAAVDVGWDFTDGNGRPVESGTPVTVSLIMAPEYYARYGYDWDALTDGSQANGELGPGAILSTTFILDTEAPVILTEDGHAPYTQEKIHTDAYGNQQWATHIIVNAVDDCTIYDAALYNEYYAQDGQPMLIQEFSPDIILRYLETPTLIPTGPGEIHEFEFDGLHNRQGFWDYGWGRPMPDGGKNAGTPGDGVYIIKITDAAGNYTTYRIFVNTESVNTATGVDISDTEIELLVGQTYRLTAQANPAQLEDRGVTWSSSAPGVARVDPDTGVVTAVGKGDAVITATAKAKGLDGAGEPVDVTAVCLVRVKAIEAELNGIIWGTEGDLAWSSFNTSDLTGYRPLTDEPLSQQTDPLFFSAAYGADGTLYAATYEGSGTLYSDLYAVDPDDEYTYRRIGSGGLFGYTDMAPAYCLGEERMIATYGPYIALVDTATGGSAIGEGKVLYANSELGTYFTGITYAFSTSYMGAGVDVYYLIDEAGTVYMMGFSDFFGNGDVYLLGLTDDEYFRYFSSRVTASAFYFNSLYYDDDSGYFFYSVFNESADVSDFYAFELGETAVTVYRLGDFGKGIWPVCALFEAPSAPAEDGSGDFEIMSVERAEATMAPIELDAAPSKAAPEVVPETAPEVEPPVTEVPSIEEPVTEVPSVEEPVPVNPVAPAVPVLPIPTEPEEPDAEIQPVVPAGALQSIDVPGSPGEAQPGITVDASSRAVTVPVVADDTVNGLVTLSYDPEAMTLQSVSGGPVLMAYAQDDEAGALTIAFAGHDAVSGTTVATVRFTYSQGGDTQITLTVLEDGPTVFTDPAGSSSDVSIPLPAPVQPGPGSGGATPTTPVTPGTPGGSGTPSTPGTPGDSGTPADPGGTDIEDQDTPLAGLRPEVFQDLVPGAWYYEDAAAMIESGWMKGVSGARFAPNMPLDRAMAATILFRTQGSPADQPAAAFTDVRSTDYFAAAVDWAANIGVVHGVTASQFEPNRAVTRADLVTMLWRLAQHLGYDVRTDGSVIPETFADRDKIPSYAREAVCWAYRQGILTGRPGGTIAPTTRAEACSMIVRFLKLAPKNDDVVA